MYFISISLTGLLATLAICPNRSLAGWLTFGTNDAQPANVSAGDDGLLEDDDGDDRSIDFRIEEELATDSHVLPASSVDERSRPIVHTVFHGLVAQLERYRQLVSNFDQYLLERRQGLLFSENLTDALSLILEMAKDAPKTPALVPSQTSTQPTRPKPKPTTASSLVSFLTPRKNKLTPSKTTDPSEPTTPPRTGSKSIAASPFGPHYKQTRDITVEPFVASMDSGPWSPMKSKAWTSEDDDPFSSGNQWGEKGSVDSKSLNSADDDETDQSRKTDNVTLSQLLDNVVILEESIKELVAIIHARRSLGIDAVRYL